MKERKPLQYRPHVAIHSDVMRRIGHRLCWHFDAFVLRHGVNDYYIVIEERRGGRIRVANHIAPRFYQLRPDGGLVVASEADVIGAHSVTLDRLPRAPRDAIMRAHNDYVIPWAYDVPVWARNVSRRLHYWPVSELPAIPEGTMNSYERGGMIAGPIVYHSDATAEQNAKTTYSAKTGV